MQIKVKNEETTGNVWVCNECRRKPPTQNSRRINERYIEPVGYGSGTATSNPGSAASGRLSVQSTSSSMTNQHSDQNQNSRPSLIRNGFIFLEIFTHFWSI